MRANVGHRSSPTAKMGAPELLTVGVKAKEELTKNRLKMKESVNLKKRPILETPEAGGL